MPENRLTHLIHVGSPPRSHNNPIIVEVGRATLWKPSQSGNPGGRTKRTPFADACRAVANLTVKILGTCWLGNGCGAFSVKTISPSGHPCDEEFAAFFAKQWGRLVGPVQLVYARTPEGRRMLLRARVHSLAGAFQKHSERVSGWK